MYQDYYNFLKPKGRIEVGLKQMDTGFCFCGLKTHNHLLETKGY